MLFVSRTCLNEFLSLLDVAWVNKVLYCIVLYCIVLYCIVLYCIVLYVTADKRGTEAIMQPAPNKGKHVTSGDNRYAWKQCRAWENV